MSMDFRPVRARILPDIGLVEHEGTSSRAAHGSSVRRFFEMALCLSASLLISGRDAGAGTPCVLPALVDAAGIARHVADPARFSSASEVFGGTRVASRLARANACRHLAQRNGDAANVDLARQSGAIEAGTVRRRPEADAGRDQTIDGIGIVVNLDGTSSTDPGGRRLRYHWELIQSPPRSRATIVRPTSARPAFLPDKKGLYRAELIVDNGRLMSVPDSVRILVGNTPPVADAGPDQTATVGATVRLNGSNSTDIDGDRLHYRWRFQQRPPGSAARLRGAHTVEPRFVIDLPGTYVVQLVVNDKESDSPIDTVVVSTGNSAPVAKAGPDQTVKVGRTVRLDGSRSSDVDGDSLTFQWSFVSKPAASTATLTDPTSIKPAFVVDKRGFYRLRLVVNDGRANSRPDFVTITTENSAPVANAGPDQTVRVTDTVTLDGSGSTDVDGDHLTYDWSLTDIPDGSAATLNDPTAVMPTFVVDKPGLYVAQLIVRDGRARGFDKVMVTTENSPPVANAGPDQSAHPGKVILLDGTGSSDVDGDPLTFQWSFTERPPGSGAVLDNPTSPMPSFVADLPGDFVVQLIVNDGKVNSDADTVKISTINSRPVANAGPDQVGVLIGTTVTLDGSASSDADDHPLTYSWSFLSRPDGSLATLDNPSAVFPTFVADLTGDYVLQLIVNDGFENSDPPDTVTIKVSGAPHADAGPDDFVTPGETVQLDGTGSSGFEGHPITYSWTFTEKPAGSIATLAGDTTASPTFVADLVGKYVVQLTVTDSALTTDTDSVTVTAAEAALIDFETLSDGEELTTQISGVTFSNATALTAGISLNELEFPPHSGVNVVVDSGGPLTMTFDAPIVSFRGFFTYLSRINVTALDADGNVLGTVTSRFVTNTALSGDPGSSPNEELKFTSTTGIRSIVVFGNPGGGSFVLDDAMLTPAQGALDGQDP